MKMLNGSKALPPWVDVKQVEDQDYWVSPALPCLPAREPPLNGRFEAYCLTARAMRHAIRRGKEVLTRVELRLVRIGMTLAPDGSAIPDDPTGGGLHQTLAYAAVPLKRFLATVLPPLGRSVTAYEFTMYETGVSMAGYTVGGGFYSEPTISVKIARGVDVASGGADVNMMFVFGEGARSLKRFARELKKTQDKMDRDAKDGKAGRPAGGYVVRVPMYLDSSNSFVFGYARRIVKNGLGRGVLTENLNDALVFGTLGEAESAGRTLLGKSFHPSNVACYDELRAIAAKKNADRTMVRRGK